MNAFLKLPKGELAAMVEAQRREELKKKFVDPLAPLFREVRGLVIRKCKAEKQEQVREILEKQAFGELERLVTQRLLDVTKRVAKDEWRNESWMAKRVANEASEENAPVPLQARDRRLSPLLAPGGSLTKIRRFQK